MAAPDISGLLAAAVSEHAWPGAVLGATDRRRCLLCEAVGRHTYDGERATRISDLFDLASLTKVVGTTTATMILCQTGDLDLDAPVVEALPEFARDTVGGPAAEARRKVTLRHLLAHASGLPAYVPFHRRQGIAVSDRAGVVLRTGLAAVPGTQALYSDVGLMIAGLLIERVTGSGLDRFLAGRVFTPLGLKDTVFRPGPEHLPRTVPTEVRPGTEAPLTGTVHDENARWLGGVAGHAGLFSTVRDLLCFSRMLLNGGTLEGTSVVSAETIAAFTRRAGIVAGSSRCLGWDSPSGESSGGEHLSPDSFGHTGFTGTSLWIDPANGLAVVLLSNAVHPHRECRLRSFFGWRRRLHSAVYEALGLAP